MNRVVVAGGGVVGASAAFHLAKAGVETILVDRHDPGHATAAGAGIISPGTSTRPLPAFFPFAQAAVRQYPMLIEDLVAAGQTDTRYEVAGELILARTEEEFERLPALARLYEERRAGGMPNLGAVSAVDGKTAREMFPALGNVLGALYVPEAARVDGDFLRQALIGAATTHGAAIRSGAITLHLEGDQVAGVVVDGERVDADAVIVATGAWTNELLAPTGFSVPVEPQRGQILHISMGDTDTSRWPILGGTGDQYILTFGPNRVVSGATRETGSGFDVRLTVGGLQSVFNHAMGVAPGLAAGTVHEIRIGLRPLSADGLPYLGRLPGQDQVIVATGHGPSGLTIGPYSGLVAAQLALGQPIAVDLAPFSVDRNVSGHEYGGH